MINDVKSLPRPAKLYLLYSGISSLYFAWPIFIAYVSGRFGIANVGLYFSVIAVTSLIMEVPTGYIADYFGKRFSVISGIICKIAAIGILVSFSDTWSLVLNAFLYGLGNALVSGALDALIYDSVDHDTYEKSVSLEVPFYQSGLVISALLGGYLFQINQHLPVLAEMALLFILIIPVWLMGVPKPHAEHETVLKISEALSSIRRIVTHKISLIFLAVYLTIVATHEIFIDITLEKKMIELQLQPSVRGIIIAVIKVIALFLLQGLMLKKITSVRNKALFSIGLSIVALPVIGLSASVAAFLPFYLLTNASTMLRDTFLSPIMQCLSQKRTRATDISMYSLAGRLPVAIFAPLTTVYLSYHSTRLVYIMSALSLIAIVPLMVQILRWYELRNSKVQKQ